ncbi:hypothetical protein M427DRAFT_48043 [Gonapodya prolifera JEL478]|uniref:Fatty acid hydroxylase domain-containing protein n=1 Tax=Gonapodya prolifera (strain JEL478) TaxID=1344416 RepID=A0A139A1G1_GONPJ|nr:hypothetical protein M427DRAFT_48043 [Gonapodya prolifera JEL478]|eukprot:KXS10592.1 hypothetical protein M427DRAFT_48043 [Gonapodya prolifera JEL478]
MSLLHVDLASTGLNQLSSIEIASIVAPLAAFWLSCCFLEFLAPALPFLDKYRVVSKDRRIFEKNLAPFDDVLWSAFHQQLLQAAIAIVFAVVTHDPLEANRIEDPATLVLKLVGGFVVMSTYQFWAHRYMHHNPWIFRNVHSVHHRILETHAFTAFYEHPLETVVNLLGGAIGCVVFSMTPFTGAIYCTITTVKAVEEHSCYRFPLFSVTPSYLSNAEHHRIHHLSKGIKSNFD